MNEQHERAVIPTPSSRALRIRENYATAAADRAVAAAAALDHEAFANVLAEGYSEDVEGPDGPPARTVPREEMLVSIGHFLKLPGFSFQIETLATLGSYLDLHRTTLTAPSLDERPALNIVMNAVGEANSERQLVHFQAYGPQRLRQAIERLYQLFASSLPAGPERDAASFAAASYAVENELVNQGRVKARTDARPSDVLALDVDAYVLRYVTISGESGNGDTEPNLISLAFFPNGRIRCLELFEPDDEAAALERLDELRSLA